MVFIKLGQKWTTAHEALKRLSDKEARLALAVATTKTAKSVGLAASDAYTNDGLGEVPFRVARMATPGRLKAYLEANGIYEAVLPGARQGRLTGPALRAAMAEMARTGQPVQRRAKTSPPQGPVWVKMNRPDVDPNDEIAAGAFAVVTRAGQPWRGSASNRAGKHLAILAYRLSSRRLPIESVGRIYARPSTNFAQIANHTARHVFPALMSQTVHRALQRSGMPQKRQSISVIEVLHPSFRPLLTG